MQYEHCEENFNWKAYDYVVTTRGFKLYNKKTNKKNSIQSSLHLTNADMGTDHYWHH